MSTELLTANHAAAKAVALAARANRNARGFGGGLYPITPQTECIELLSGEEIEKGHVVLVESEHSAMGVCIGTSVGGARSFTASSSNGLAYMCENVFAAAFFRLPIVMMAVNRTLGPPWNIWVDHGDTLMLRDSGWMQFYCEDNQEVLDSILLAYRIAEDHRVLLPAMVCQDAFVLSHTTMNTEIPTQEEVDAFLPELDLPHRISDVPVTMGGLDFPHETEAHREQFQAAMTQVPAVYEEAARSFAEIFGREIAPPVETYLTDDAEILLVSMGTTASTARVVVDEARARGVKVGSARVRMFRPLPEARLKSVLSGRARIAVMDRDLSPGWGGILGGELRALAPHDALYQNYLLGLGGGDIRPQHVKGVLDDLLAREAPEAPKFMEVAV